MYRRLEEENSWSKTKKNAKMKNVAMWQKDLKRMKIIR